MEKTKGYDKVRFSPEVIEEAYYLFMLRTNGPEDPSLGPRTRLTFADETWSYDSLEEFIADYPRAEDYDLEYWAVYDNTRFSVCGDGEYVSISIGLPSKYDVESVFRVFERNLDRSVVQIKEIQECQTKRLTVFISHGRSRQWRDLKDHLQDHHAIKVTAYEIGPRAGFTVKEVLESMLTESSFALLVLTGEDIDAEGELHARENVIHEVGLFQGKLGFRRAIVLLEQGCEEFSNIYGLNQIRFSKGNIRETFGDVLATIRREFEHAA